MTISFRDARFPKDMILSVGEDDKSTLPVRNNSTLRLHVPADLTGFMEVLEADCQQTFTATRFS